MLFPTPIGGTILPVDFVPSALFAFLYAALLPLLLFRTIDTQSRCISLVSTTFFTVERLITYFLRAYQSRNNKQPIPSILLGSLQISYGNGCVTMSGDLLNILRCLLVNATFSRDMYEQAPAAQDAPLHPMEDDSRRGTVFFGYNFFEGWRRERFTGQPRATDPDHPKRRLWFRRVQEIGMVFFILVLLVSIAANQPFGRIGTLPTGQSSAASVFRLRYIATSLALFLILAIAVMTVWARVKLPRVRTKAVGVMLTVCTLLIVVAVYRLSVMYNERPHNLDSAEAKAGFYMLHSLPEWLACVLLLSVSVRQLFGTGPYGDLRRADETEEESMKRLEKAGDHLLSDVIAASNDAKNDAQRPSTTSTHSTSNDKLCLPPLDQWRRRFPPLPSVIHRVSVRNPETAHAIADAFVPEGSRDKVIIEAYPGPGQLTRALMDLPRERISKIIVLEENQGYLEYLHPLEKADPRVKVLPVGGYNWNSYLMVDEMQLLKDVAALAWEDGVHPSLHFVSHLPSSIEGEQLIAQFLRSIPDQQWLFKYGRVPMSFVLSDHLWKRISAPLGAGERCKLTVIAEATADCSYAVPPPNLLPYELHFHPARPAVTTSPDSRKNNTRRVGNPFQAINIIPHEQQAIKKGHLDEWDFCLRRLYVQRATALGKALPSLAPGAKTLVKGITDLDLPMSERIDFKKRVRHLTVDDWKIIIKAFREWPFAPQNLSITDTFTAKDPRF